MSDDEDDLGIKDTSGLTDADWAVINRIRAAYKAGGQAGLAKALEVLLEKDPISYAVVVGAFFPNELREAIKDEMASRGLDEDDLREMIRKLESPARNQ